MTKAKLKLNKDFPARGLKKGSMVNVELDSNNIPLDLYWRRRLKDSAIDDCVEIIGNKKIDDNQVIDKVFSNSKKNK